MQIMMMVNIMGSFVIQSQVLFNFIEKSQGNISTFQYMGQRLLILQMILVLSIVFPSINVVLGLITGSFCAVILNILPVFFYRTAFKDSKKDRRLV